MCRLKIKCADWFKKKKRHCTFTIVHSANFLFPNIQFWLDRSKCFWFFCQLFLYSYIYWSVNESDGLFSFSPHSAIKRPWWQDAMKSWKRNEPSRFSVHRPTSEKLKTLAIQVSSNSLSSIKCSPLMFPTLILLWLFHVEWINCSIRWSIPNNEVKSFQWWMRWN